jgi:hypothetical protein
MYFCIYDKYGIHHQLIGGVPSPIFDRLRHHASSRASCSNGASSAASSRGRAKVRAQKGPVTLEQLQLDLTNKGGTRWCPPVIS